MAPQVSLSTIRIATRVSLSFVLEQMRVGRTGRDLVDDLIILTIVQANVEPLSRDAELQRTYGALDCPPPDELRRPVSISAVANALTMPYETVRRRVGQMAADGVCEITPKGVYVSTAGLNTPRHRALLNDNYAAVRAFYRRLCEIGYVPATEISAAPWAGDHPPVRAVARISSDYFLRQMEPVTQHMGDVVTGLVMLAMLRANTEGLGDGDRGTDEHGQMGFVDDEKRRPVSVSALATRLAIPPETVRRHVTQLLETGRCERMRGGLVVPSAVLAGPDVQRVMYANQIHLHRMLASLGNLGILDAWEDGKLGLRMADRDAEPA